MILLTNFWVRKFRIFFVFLRLAAMFLHAFITEASDDRQSGVEFVYFGFSCLDFFMVLFLYLRGFKLLL